METLKRLIKDYPYLVTLTVILGISQIISSLGLFPEPAPWDTIVHFVFSIFISQVIYLALIDFRLLAKDQSGPSFTPARVVLLVVFIGTTVGVGWEIVEWFADHFMGAHLQLGNDDTMTDLMADLTGSAVGGFILLFIYRLRRRR